MTRVGILGGGQLGRLLALSGLPLGLKFRFLDPDAQSPVTDLAVDRTVGPFDEVHLARFADGLDVATYESENIPARAATFLGQRVPLYPSASALALTQDRVLEKQFLGDLGIPTTTFVAAAGTPSDLRRAIDSIGLPAVVKQRTLGYDGRGQFVVHAVADLERIPPEFATTATIVERLVSFRRELSLIAARAVNGTTCFYPLVENIHAGGILRRTLAPAPHLDPRLQDKAARYAERLLNALDYVGVLAIEMFDCAEGLLVNELAPRVHNSGHWTIEGAVTSQFENHLRAITGLPLGDPSAIGVSVMINLLGTLPDAAAVLQIPECHLHLYGKSPRPGRKLGHLTLRASDPACLATRVRNLENLLRPCVVGANSLPLGNVRRLAVGEQKRRSR